MLEPLAGFADALTGGVISSACLPPSVGQRGIRRRGEVPIELEAMDENSIKKGEFSVNRSKDSCVGLFSKLSLASESAE